MLFILRLVALSILFGNEKEKEKGVFLLRARGNRRFQISEARMGIGSELIGIQFSPIPIAQPLWGLGLGLEFHFHSPLRHTLSRGSPTTLFGYGSYAGRFGSNPNYKK